MAVLVLDKKKQPLMPCSEKRARLLLERKQAVVVRRVPFTIRLKNRLLENSVVQPVSVCINPGSQHTGIAVCRESSEDEQLQRFVLMLLELNHRGHAIRDALTQRRAFRRRRRSQLRYRAPRFLNRSKPQGWLAPSLRHRVETTLNWIKRLQKLVPVSIVRMELVKFDTQQLQNPEIARTEYQQGTLAGYEVREYLLEKWHRTCAYCAATNTPLQIEHIQPKSQGGSHRISNLTLACADCNQKKSNQPVELFLKNKPELLKKIHAQAKAPLKDAAAVNSTRWALFRAIQTTGLNVTTGTGGQTKWNRTRLNIPKTHALDAACVGNVDQVRNTQKPTLAIKAMGRGSYQRTRLDRFGFPRGYLTRHKSVLGFQTGDMVHAHVPSGKKQGTYTGRVAVRASGSFNVTTSQGVVQGISYKHCIQIQRNDGYQYQTINPTIAQPNGGCEKQVA